jgi:hypothetical protein
MNINKDRIKSNFYFAIIFTNTQYYLLGLKFPIQFVPYLF